MIDNFLVKKKCLIFAICSGLHIFADVMMTNKNTYWWWRLLQLK